MAILSAVEANIVFDRCVADYHAADNVDAPRPDPYGAGTPQAELYEKCWVDAVQWHLEDLVRDPAIDPAEGMALKRRIDRSNQVRTDMVERIDSRILDHFAAAPAAPAAPVNTESPAWALDRLSILALKIWHMREQAQRADADEAHRARAAQRLDILLEQRDDLTGAIDTLLDDLAAGRRRMKTYRQMKLYNDPSTNPVLYRKQ